MASMITRLNIEKLDGNIVQKHGGSKQVGFKQLDPCVKTGAHGVHVQKCVWFEVELHGAQENSKDEVHHGANVGAVIIKTGVPGQEGIEGNAAEKCRGDNNTTALRVIAVIEEYAHESLTFRDAVACEVIFNWISVMKEDMDTRSSMCMPPKGLRQRSDDNNIYYWKYAPGGHSTLSLEGGMLGNRDEERKLKKGTWLKGLYAE
nr:zinc finger, CCHC-type [Tanacetum cinerariifolium]